MHPLDLYSLLFFFFPMFLVLLLMLHLVSLHLKGYPLVPLLLWRRKAICPPRKLMMALPMPMLLPPHPLQALPAFTLRICKLHFFLIDSFVDFLFSIPNVSRARFSIIPFDNEHGPSNCLQHLLLTNEEGDVGPVEVIPGAFDIFRDTSWLWVNPYVLSIGSLSPFSYWFSNYFRSIDNARRFTELRPFVNVSAVTRSQISADAFRNHVLWQNSARSVIFTMIGIVQSCHVVTPTTLGQHLCKAITIVPYGHAWRKFLLFLGQLYGEGEMKGPYEYGCLLTLSGCRSGWSSRCIISLYFLFLTFNWYHISDVVNTPVTPRKNAKAFGGSGGSGTAKPHEWFDNKIPNCIDFDKAGEYFTRSLMACSLMSSSSHIRRVKHTLPFPTRRFRQYAQPPFVSQQGQDFRPPCWLPRICVFLYVVLCKKNR